MNGIIFRLQHTKSEDWDGGDEYVPLFKIKYLTDQFDDFFRAYPIRPQSIFDVGLFGCGSLVYWFEYFHPKKIIGIDIADKSENAYFTAYREKRGLQDRMKAYWNVDQADQATLQSIVRGEFGGEIDLVIDDASHGYEQTRATFEILFPFLKNGGMFILEDWAWGHWSEHNPGGASRGMTPLICKLLEFIGTTEYNAQIQSMYVCQGFCVVIKGDSKTSQERMNVDTYIYNDIVV